MESQDTTVWCWKGGHGVLSESDEKGGSFKKTQRTLAGDETYQLAELHAGRGEHQTKKGRWERQLKGEKGKRFRMGCLKPWNAGKSTEWCGIFSCAQMNTMVSEKTDEIRRRQEMCPGGINGGAKPTKTLATVEIFVNKK